MLNETYQSRNPDIKVGLLTTLLINVQCAAPIILVLIAFDDDDNDDSSCSVA